MAPRKTANTTEAPARKEPIRRAPARKASAKNAPPSPEPTATAPRKPKKTAPPKSKENAPPRPKETAPPKLKKSAPSKSKKTAPPKPAAEAWTPPAIQKTDLERSICQIGTVVPRKLRSSKDSHSPNFGVLDRLGYRLAGVPYSREDIDFDKENQDKDRVAKMMGVPSRKVTGLTMMYFQDQVARDLDIPYHMVEMPEYEEWYRRGFRADPTLWDESSRGERERLDALAIGSVFRKGSSGN